MKKFISTALVLAVATLTIHAQDVSERKTDRTTDRHQRESFKDLQLSDDQKAKFRSTNDEYRLQMQELRKKDDITVKEQRSRMETLRKDHQTKMQGILTSEQKAKLQKMKEDRTAKHQADREKRGQEMKTRLGLTDDQSAKLKKSHTDMADKMKAIRENSSLTDDQRKDEMKKLKDQQHENLKSILTADQIKKLQDRKGRRHGRRSA
jgi:Spy/CpxP family protein refolding chaperone